MAARRSDPRFRFSMLSHVGRVRTGNEDTCRASAENGIFLVCDGMGGAAAGEVASQMAAETFLASLQAGLGVVGEAETAEADGATAPRRATPDLRLAAATEAANRAVFDHARSKRDLAGMGTTLVALLLDGAAGESAAEAPSLTLVHVGDSRCYRLRGGELKLLTEDHSLVGEQVRAGQITAAEAEQHPLRNIITRAIGTQPTVEAEIQHVDSELGDLYLLASDGLTRDLSDAALRAIFQRACRNQRAQRAPNLESLCRTLIDEANDAGGGDNITVLLLHLPRKATDG